VKVPTSPGWGPFFGGRRAAAAVLAAAVNLVVPFFLLVLLLGGVRCFFDEGCLVIQPRCVKKASPLTLSDNNCFCPGGGAGDWFIRSGNRRAA